MTNSIKFLHSIDRFLRSDGECLNRDDDIDCSALTIIFQHPETSWYDSIGNSNALTWFALKFTLLPYLLYFPNGFLSEKREPRL